MAPVNCFSYLFSAVPERPYLDLDQIPSLEQLTKNWEVIKHEAKALLAQEAIKGSTRYDDIGFNSFFRRGWGRYYLKWYGTFLPSAELSCPKTVALLQGLPEVNAAMFAFLPAGSQLMPHRDPYAGSLRYHLGLITPNNDLCQIIVDGESYGWRDGEAILFDETYLHWAKNKTDRDRLILLCDVSRPLRSRIAAALLNWFGQTFVAAARSRNVPGEKVGFLNILFAGFYRIRLVGKALKRRSRVLYYLLKYALIGYLLWLWLR